MTKNNTYNKILIKYMIFRSLANLTAHKRSYCLERYEDDDDDNDDDDDDGDDNDDNDQVRGCEPRVQQQGGGRGGGAPDCDSGGRGGGDHRPRGHRHGELLPQSR